MKSVDSRRKLFSSTRVFALNAAFSPETDKITPFSRRPSPVRACKIPASQYQVRQSEQREELRFVFRQPFVSHLAVTEQILHHMERMLYLRTHAGLGPLQCLEGHAIRVPFTARDFPLRCELGIRKTDLLHEGEHRAAA